MPFINMYHTFSFLHSQLIKYKTPHICGFVNGFRQRLSCAVSGIGFDSYQYRIVSFVFVHFLHGSRKFERMCRYYTIVMIGGSDKRCGIRHAASDVVQRRIFIKVSEILFVLAFVRIQPPIPNQS